jgi:phage terminase large subunit-like protein
VNFQRLDLNLRVQNVSAPIDAARWEACAGPRVEGTSQLARDWKALREWVRGAPCWLGADCAWRGDMIALVAWFPERRVILPWYWATEAAAHERFRKNEAMYYRWRDAGALLLEPGNSLQLRPVAEKVEELKTLYKPLGLGIDPALALEFSYAAGALGIEPVAIKQGWITMTGPCDWLVNDVVNPGNLVHGNHPVLNWNAANLRFKLVGERGKQPTKPGEAFKIDGMSAWLTSRALETLKAEKPKPRSVYEERGPIVV